MSVSYLNPMNAVTSMIPKVQPYSPMYTVTNAVNPASFVSGMYANNQNVPQYAPYNPSTNSATAGSTSEYTLNWGTPMYVNTNFGLNPGFMQAVPIQTSNSTQNQFNWGAVPFQTGTRFNSQIANQSPTPVKTTSVPVKPTVTKSVTPTPVKTTTTKVTTTKPAVVKR